MIRFTKLILSAGLNGLSLGLLALPARAAQSAALPANLPLYFEANQGQVNVPAPFIARGHDYQFLISPAEVQIALHNAATVPAAVRMQFIGASAQAQVCGDAELSGKINYLTGNDPAQWRTGLATFARVRVGGLYPGVNLVYYGNQQQLEYDFAIAPGTDPSAIAIHFDGVDKISVNSQGELILSLAGGEIRQPRPVIYQTPEGARKEIEGGYRLVDAHTIAFAIGQYDHSQPLVIDPLLTFSTYFGGTAGDTAWAVAVDTNGFIYMAGQTLSQKFYTNGPDFSTLGAFQTNYAGGKLTGDAFVAKLNNAGTNIIYLTYLGGSADDGAFSLALDAAGDVYVTGFTDSPDFPTTTNAPYRTISGILNKTVGFYPVDAFVTELSSDGSSLVYSTYLGGSGEDAGFGIAVDSANNAYVTGFTYSSNFPAISGINYTSNSIVYTLPNKLTCTNSFVNANVFIAKIHAGGSSVDYSTYFGGNNFEQGSGIAVDTNGSVYVTGFTVSTNFPTINYIHQTIGNATFDGHVLNCDTNKNRSNKSSDAFVAKFDPTGTNLIYSTLLGSTNDDAATGIAVDNSGAAYVTGWTVSTNFPNTILTNIAGLTSFMVTNTRPGYLSTNVFLAKITNGLQAGIAWSTVFGGKGADVGNCVAVDPAGHVFVTGSASSTNFPTLNVPGFLIYTNSGKSDAFVIAFNTNAPSMTAPTNLLYSTYLGGKQNDYGYGIAVDAEGNAYVVGQTLSTNFPAINAAQAKRQGTNDAFLARIMLTVPQPVISENPASQTNSVGSTVYFTINGEAYQPYFFQWQYGTNLVIVTNVVSGTNLVVTNLVDGSDVGGATNLTLTITNAQTTNGGLYYQMVVTNYGGSATSSVAYLLITNVPPAITVQPTNQLVGVGSFATFTVIATGTVPLSYQWQLDGTNLLNGARISGATNATLTITNAQTSDSATNYTVIVTNIAGSVTSSPAFLMVQTSPVFTVQPPTNQSMAVGATATFAITAVGTVPLHYFWQVTGTNLVNRGRISGATNTMLIITNAQTSDSATNYTVIVTNVAGSVTSSPAILLVTNIPPAITLQPTNQLVGAGSTVDLAIAATGTAPLSYQWQTNGTGLLNGGRISGATNATLIISSVQTNDSGGYSVVVTNFGGSVTSSIAGLTVATSPVITTQPITNQAIAVGANATFMLTAVGTGPLHYQWQTTNGINLVNGSHISGATSNVLSFIQAQTTNSNNYRVIVTNIAGSVTSSVAALTVTNIPPAITLQPTNRAVVAGTTVTLAVAATGTPPLHYQWQTNGINLVNGGRISGVISSLLTLSTAQTNDSGSYSVIVTNFGGSVTSSIAVLTVAAAPVILVQPTNQTVVVGSNTTFAVKAIGTTPLHFQWQTTNGTALVNGGRISGATSNLLTISTTQTNDSVGYQIVITNVVGSVTSSVAVLTVLSSPVILVQPTNQSMAVGATATLVVDAIGMAPLSYQWQVDVTNLLDGATNNILTLTDVQTTNSGSYTVTVMNPDGSVTSSNAVLTVTNIPPGIGTQPESQTVSAGSSVTFVVLGNGTGTPPFFFQWQMDGTDLVDGLRIDGAANYQLTIADVQANDAGNYQLIVTNYGGSVTSSVAVLTVEPLVPPLGFQGITPAGGGSFILSGTGGTSNGTYYVLASTNLLLPLGLWTPIGTNQFDGLGDFIFTNTAQTNIPQQFYLLKY
ncbi:MAG: beta strand repeat-containing protein [Limisphaerales bacterium]